VKREPATSSEYEAFKSLLGRILDVPHSEIVRREAEYKKQSDANPRKRGPKKKRQISVGS
jgi:hypothetical protein